MNLCLHETKGDVKENKRRAEKVCNDSKELGKALQLRGQREDELKHITAHLDETFGVSHCTGEAPPKAACITHCPHVICMKG